MIMAIRWENNKERRKKLKEEKNDKNVCPKCKNALEKGGKIKVMGKKGRRILIDFFYCKICGWRGT